MWVMFVWLELSQHVTQLSGPNTQWVSEWVHSSGWLTWAHRASWPPLSLQRVRAPPHVMVCWPSVLSCDCDLVAMPTQVRLVSLTPLKVCIICSRWFEWLIPKTACRASRLELRLKLASASPFTWQIWRVTCYLKTSSWSVVYVWFPREVIPLILMIVFILWSCDCVFKSRLQADRWCISGSSSSSRNDGSSATHGALARETAGALPPLLTHLLASLAKITVCCTHTSDTGDSHFGQSITSYLFISSCVISLFDQKRSHPHVF